MNQKCKIRNRQSYRLQDYDYSYPGSYFVTIVSYKRWPIFSEIVDGEIRLNHIGKIVEDCWKETHKHFIYVSVNTYAIMPNHLHGIVKIHGKRSVVATSKTPPIFINGQDSIPKGPSPQSLSAIIGSFKSAATKRIHKSGLIKDQFVWQRSFYEHVIRDDEDYHRIVQYIQFNPHNWENDQEFFPMDLLIREDKRFSPI
jgi:putative transposase